MKLGRKTDFYSIKYLSSKQITPSFTYGCQLVMLPDIYHMPFVNCSKFYSILLQNIFLNLIITNDWSF